MSGDSDAIYKQHFVDALKVADELFQETFGNPNPPFAYLVRPGESKVTTGMRRLGEEAKRLQSLNVDLTERIAAASHALTISAERQGEQAREIARLREQIADAEEALSMATTYRHQQTEEIASLRERVDRLAAACIVTDRIPTRCHFCGSYAYEPDPLVHREGCAVEDQR